MQRVKTTAFIWARKNRFSNNFNNRTRQKFDSRKGMQGRIALLRQKASRFEGLLLLITHLR
jgi:hypothetical protein